MWLMALGSLLVVSFAAALLAFAYVGLFNRWVADDYCCAAWYRMYGFFGNQKYWYDLYSGRVSMLFVSTVAFLFGPKLMPPALPSLLLAFWLISLAWAIGQWGKRMGWPQPQLTSFFLAELILVNTLSRTPTIYQSLYWMASALTYTSPLILLPLLIGMLSRVVGASRLPSHRRFLLTGLSGAIAFAAGGFNEMYLAFQLGGLLLAILLCAMSRSGDSKRNLLPLLIASLFGSILAGIISKLSPGNEVRVAEAATKSLFVPPRDWLSLLTICLRFTGETISQSVFSSRPTAAAAFLLPAMVAFHLHGASPQLSTGQLLKWLILSPIIAFALIAFYVAPVGYLAAYVRGGYSPQPRTGIGSQFIFFCFACVWGYLAGLWLCRVPALSKPKVSHYIYWGSALLAVVLLVVPFNAARRVLAITPIVKQYAATWDTMDREIRAAKRNGQTSFIAPNFSATDLDARGNRCIFGVRLLGPDSTNWVNECATEYYGVKSIVARD